MAGSPTEATAVSAPPRFLAWKQAGPAASSAVLSSKCLLTWVRRCLSVGTGPGDESGGAGSEGTERNKAAGNHGVPAA